MNISTLNGNNHSLISNTDIILTGDNQDNVSDNLPDASDIGDENDLESMRKRIQEMEEEAEKLKQMQLEVEKQMQLPSTPGTRTYTIHTIDL
jgi:hypothetical protein